MDDADDVAGQDAIASSPSSTSLTSDEEPFDHTAQPASSTKPPVLGLRELAALRKSRKRAKNRPETPTQIELLQPVTQKDDLEYGDTEIRQDSLLSLPPSPGVGRLPFASDVEIKGWKIVGGRGWSGAGKVGAYVVYEVQVTLRDGGTLSILRRYTDFERLRTLLKTRYPHLRASIPKLPSKNHMSKFDEKFLEERQPRLQRFLKTVMLHPEMGRGGAISGTNSAIGEWVTG